MNQQDWCEFFKKIEDDPTRIVSGITVRDVIKMREHVRSCGECYDRTERVNAKTPPQTFMDIQGLN